MQINKYLDKKLDLIKARTANLFLPKPKKKTFYLHIPKCGGTSFNKALQDCYIKWSLSDTDNIINLNSPASWEAIEKSIGTAFEPTTVNDYPVMKFREELLLYCMSQRHVDFISGHFPFSRHSHKEFSDQFAFITILRDPVERWISSYFYNKNRQGHRYRKIDLDFEAYLKSDYARSQGYEYAKFLAGVDEQGEYMTAQAVAKAQENLHCFALVGFLHDMPTLLQKFEQLFGRNLNIGTLNKKPKSENLELMTLIEKNKLIIQEICQPDIEIYDYALKQFGQTSDATVLSKV